MGSRACDGRGRGRARGSRCDRGGPRGPSRARGAGAAARSRPPCCRTAPTLSVGCDLTKVLVVDSTLRNFVLSHFTGREGGMTTVWRPRVRIPVPDIDGADVDEKRKEELTTKGKKRKRAPPTKGPCEHGVKKRWACKVCSACPHGHRRSICKECGGSQICEHGRHRSVCKECGGASICEHGRVRSVCKECGGAGICEHGRQRYQCKECGGASFCEHGRRRSQCKECGGSGICEHGRRRYRCKECQAAKQ